MQSLRGPTVTEDNLTQANPFARPALRSVIVLAILCALYAASFWIEGSSSTQIPYKQHSGYVYRDGDGTDGYFVTTVQRDDKPPWLIAAVPLPLPTDGFRTAMTSSPLAVSINDTEYRESPNQTIIVLDDGRGASVRHLPNTNNAVIELLAQDIDAINASELESLFAARMDDEPIDATGPR